MKRIVCLTMLLAATLARAQWIDAAGAWQDSLPSRYEGAGGVWSHPSADWLMARAGWRPATAEEIAAHAAAVAQAEAEARAQASLPLMSAAGFAALNEAGHWVKFIPATTNDISDALAVQISHSPPDPVVAAQMERDAKSKWKAGKDAEAASAAKKLAAIESAGKNGKVNDRLNAIEAALKELLK